MGRNGFRFHTVLRGHDHNAFAGNACIGCGKNSLGSRGFCLEHPESLCWRVKKGDLSGISVPGIDEFSVEKHHAYVTLFYDIKNCGVIHIEQSEESDVFMQKNSFPDPAGIENITMDMCPPYISGAKEFFPCSRR